MKRVVMLMACGMLWNVSAEAQICRGAVTFKDAPIRWGVNAALSSNTHGIEAGVAKGYNQFFAGGGVVLQGVSGTNAAKGFIGGVGTEYSDVSQTYFVCPTAVVSHLWGASPVVDMSASATRLNLGATVGFELNTTIETRILPTAGFFFNHLSTSVDQGAGVSLTTGSSFASIQLGVGLLFNERMSLTPSLILPFNTDIGETSFTALLTMKLGK